MTILDRTRLTDLLKGIGNPMPHFYIKRRNIMKNIFIEKAKKWLEENNIEFVDRHIIEETPTAEELTEWIKQSNQEIKKWFNTSGLKYKALNLKDKLPTLSDKEKIELLSSDGMLIKRPLLITDNQIFIGFKEEQWKNLNKKEEN